MVVEWVNGADMGRYEGNLCKLQPHDMQTTLRLTTSDLAAAEMRWLRERGFDELRVRVHAGELARLELPATELERFMAHREAFVAHLESLGFLYVSLDLKGFRSGSMNAVLAPRARDAAAG